MDGLRRMMANIGKYLGTLTATQKLLIVALVAIAALSLVVVAMSAGKSEMVELMPGISTDQQAKAKSFLDSMNISYRAEGGKLLVKPDQRSAILAALAEGGAMPTDTALLFANLASSTHWMNTKSQNEQTYNLALMNELSAVISKFRGLRNAKVIIDAPEPMGLGMTYRKPTASVTVFTQGGSSLSRESVDAIAAMVAGAKAGLAVTDVKVIDGTSGRQFTARGPDDLRAGDYMEQVVKIEQRVQEKLLTQLSYIRGVIVAVNAQADVRRTSSVEKRMLPVNQGSVSILSKEQTKTKSDVSGGGPGGPGNGAEPGLRSNVAEDINRGSGGPAGSKNNEETNDSTYQVAVGERQEQTTDPRGMPTRINVTINVPREYIAMLWKAQNAPAAPAGGAAPAAGTPEVEPTVQQLDEQFAKEKARLESDIQPLVETAMSDAGGAAGPGGGAQAGRVVVSMIPVPLASVGGVGGGVVGGSGSTASAGGSSMINDLIGSGLIKNAMLGVLALVALGMMMMMVRKAGRTVVLPKPEEVVGLPPALENQNDIVGEADEGQTAMEGIELDDAELKSKKMLESVSEMVKKNPADSAKIMNRWVVPAN